MDKAPLPQLALPLADQSQGLFAGTDFALAQSLAAPHFLADPRPVRTLPIGVQLVDDVVLPAAGKVAFQHVLAAEHEPARGIGAGVQPWQRAVGG